MNSLPHFGGAPLSARQRRCARGRSLLVSLRYAQFTPPPSKCGRGGSSECTSVPDPAARGFGPWSQSAMISDTQNGVDASAGIASAPATTEDTQQSRTWRCSISEATGAQQAIINKLGKDKDVTKRFATNVSCGSTAAMWFQAFFVFVKPKRRGWLQRNIVAEAEWMPAVYSEDWPEAARTSKHSVDFSHQGRASPTTGAAIGDAPSMPPQSAVRRVPNLLHTAKGVAGEPAPTEHPCTCTCTCTLVRSRCCRERP